MPRETDTPKWCFALRKGMRTTVVSRVEPPGNGAGEGPLELFNGCGFDAERGNW